MAQACLLLDCENQKTNAGENNNGGVKQGDKKDDINKAIVQLHLADWLSNIPGLSIWTTQFKSNEKLTVTIDTEGDTSPSQDSDDDAEAELPDDDVLTEHYVDILVGRDNNDVYIPTLVEVFDSIDHDYLLTQDDDKLTVNEEVPVFLERIFWLQSFSKCFY